MPTTQVPPDPIAAALAGIRARIASACRDAGRAETEVTLVAVSKTHPAEAVAAALRAGQAVFGENRVQEAAAKFPALRADHAGLRLHLIGGLQTNKAADAFIHACRGRFGTALTGLMCIPPDGQDAAPYFAKLARLAAEHGLRTLSMGMSGDFEAAILAGATHVRVGTAIFGARPRQ